MTTLYLGDAAITIGSAHLRSIIEQYGVEVICEDRHGDPERPLYRVRSDDFDVTIITDAGTKDDIAMMREEETT